MRLSWNVLVLAAGLHSVGCAVSDDEDRAATSTVASELGAPVPTGVQCSDKTWTVDFYDDAAHTTLVGRMSCVCFRPELLAGVISSYQVLVHEITCDFN